MKTGGPLASGALEPSVASRAAFFGWDCLGPSAGRFDSGCSLGSARAGPSSAIQARHRKLAQTAAPPRLVIADARADALRGGAPHLAAW